MKTRFGRFGFIAVLGALVLGLATAACAASLADSTEIGFNYNGSTYAFRAHTAHTTFWSQPFFQWFCDPVAHSSTLCGYSTCNNTHNSMGRIKATSVNAPVVTFPCSATLFLNGSTVRHTQFWITSAGNGVWVDTKFNVGDWGSTGVGDKYVLNYKVYRHDDLSVILSKNVDLN